MKLNVRQLNAAQQALKLPEIFVPFAPEVVKMLQELIEKCLKEKK